MSIAPRTVWLPIVVGLFSLVANTSSGQELPLQLKGISVAGTRTTLTESWNLMEFIVVNPTESSREARVLLYFPDRPSAQYGRDVWVPERASLKSWFPIGKTPPNSYPRGCELHSLLIDRTKGEDANVLPTTEEKVRSVLVRHRPRAPSTSLIVDFTPSGDSSPIDAASRQVETLVRKVRAAEATPEFLTFLSHGLLPTYPEAYEGTDHIVVASNRLASDPAGCRALRHWLQQGGRLWVLLDFVSPEVVASLLGEQLPFEVVDRVGLTTVRLNKPGDQPADAGQDFEQPVDLVRVLPTENDQVMVMANGWPAAFRRTVGRGRILFTTLGPRAWMKDRKPTVPATQGQRGRPVSPAWNPWIEELATESELRVIPNSSTSLSAEDLQPLVVEEIGYSIVSKKSATAILGIFLLALLAIAVVLRKSRRPELLGWLAPAAAIVTAGVFVALAINARQAVPPTVATAGIAEVADGTNDVTVNGLFAIYQPGSGEVPLATNQGGQLEFSDEGLEGQLRRRIQTDIDAWHWEGLAMPAGVRSGTFKLTTQSGPISAVAHFGPTGIEGKASASAFRDLSDSVVIASSRKAIALRMKSDGTFVAGPNDELPKNQFIAGSVLSDRQQRRQAVYRKLLEGPLPRHLEGRELLLTWAELPTTPFTAQADARAINTTLLVVPLEFERPEVGTRVTIPQSLIPVQRVLRVANVQPTWESVKPTVMHLRFQLPASVRPLAVETATFHLQIRAPSRRIAVSGMDNGQLTPLKSVDSPAEPIRVVIDDQRLLQVDAEGALHLTLEISNEGSAELDTSWLIESMGLEVVGKTVAGK